MRNNQQQSLGETIRRRRVELGMSKTDLARAVGVHKSNPAHWERGDGPNPDKIPLLAQALDMPEEQLRELHRDGFEAYTREQLATIITRMNEIAAMMQRAWVAEITADVEELEALRSAPDAPPLPKIVEHQVRSLTRRVSVLEKLSA